MRRDRAIWLAGVGCLAGTLTGCSLVHGPADREEQFVAAGAECSGSWWIGDVREGTSDEARVIAEAALAEAEVSPASFAAALSLLELSKNDDELRNTSAVDLEREAYMLAVKFHVMDQLDAAGYPDSDRVLEVWSESTCS